MKVLLAILIFATLVFTLFYLDKNIEKRFLRHLIPLFYILCFFMSFVAAAILTGGGFALWLSLMIGPLLGLLLSKFFLRASPIEAYIKEKYPLDKKLIKIAAVVDRRFHALSISDKYLFIDKWKIACSDNKEIEFLTHYLLKKNES